MSYSDVCERFYKQLSTVTFGDPCTYAYYRVFYNNVDITLGIRDLCWILHDHEECMGILHISSKTLRLRNMDFLFSLTDEEILSKLAKVSKNIKKLPTLLNEDEIKIKGEDILLCYIKKCREIYKMHKLQEL